MLAILTAVKGGLLERVARWARAAKAAAAGHRDYSTNEVYRRGRERVPKGMRLRHG
ncbi:MAG: hypothetical protein AMXMBFR61_19120 [Fimbriimonadales bacterium]